MRSPRTGRIEIVGTPVERLAFIAAYKQYVFWQSCGSMLTHENALKQVLGEAGVLPSEIDYPAVLARLRQMR